MKFKDRMPALAEQVRLALPVRGTISILEMTRRIMQEGLHLSVGEVKELSKYMHDQGMIEYVGETGVRAQACAGGGGRR